MDISEILSALDAEIDRLKQARDLLTGLKSNPVNGVVKRGLSQSKAAAVPPTRKKGGMSAEGRARIAAAQKLRWAATKSAK